MPGYVRSLRCRGLQASVEVGLGFSAVVWLVLLVLVLLAVLVPVLGLLTAVVLPLLPKPPKPVPRRGAAPKGLFGVPNPPVEPKPVPPGGAAPKDLLGVPNPPLEPKPVAPAGAVPKSLLVLDVVLEPKPVPTGAAPKDRLVLGVGLEPKPVLGGGAAPTGLLVLDVGLEPKPVLGGGAAPTGLLALEVLGEPKPVLGRGFVPKRVLVLEGPPKPLLGDEAPTATPDAPKGAVFEAGWPKAMGRGGGCTLVGFVLGGTAAAPAAGDGVGSVAGVTDGSIAGGGLGLPVGVTDASTVTDLDEASPGTPGERRNKAEGSTCSCRGLCLWHLRSPSRSMVTSCWRSCRCLWRSSVSETRYCSLSESIPSTFVGVRMVVRSWTRQLSIARLMILSTYVLSDIS
jgi:hypothetical protein